MVVRLNARLEGAAALFTELVSLEWDGPAILMQGRSGDYIANGHMTPAFAMALHHKLGKLLAKGPDNVVEMPRARKKKRKH